MDPRRAGTIEWAEDEGVLGDVQSTTPEPYGLKLTVRRQVNKTVLLFVFPHAAVDGLGAFQFIADLMVAYAHGCSADPGEPPWRKLDHGLLDDRDGHSLLNRRVRLIDLGRAARISLALLSRRAAVVDDHGAPPSAASDAALAEDFLVHTLSEHETAELGRVAQAVGSATRPVVARLLSDVGQLEPGDPRIATTDSHDGANQRATEAGLSDASGQRFQLCVPTRRTGDCRRRTSLLESIRTEMTAIKRTRRGLSYELSLRALPLATAAASQPES